MRHLAIAVLGLALLGTTARADVDSDLAALAGAKGDAYVAARDKLVSGGDATKTALEAKLAGASWTAEAAPSLAAAAIVLARLEHPEVLERLGHIEGIDPATYTKRRRPEPECAHELRRLGPEAAPLLLELHWKLLDRVSFSEGAKGAKERSALEQGIMVAVAESRHPAALWFLSRVASDANEVEAARLQAAEGIGTQASTGALAALAQLHDAKETPAPVKLATIRGAARVPSAEALAFLEARLADKDERRQAVVALGAFGSALGWQSRGAEAAKTGDPLRAKASDDLVAIVRSSEPGVEDEPLLQALATVAHPSAREALAKAKADASLSPASRALAAKAHERVETSLARQEK
jgi:hypothetical protein